MECTIENKKYVPLSSVVKASIIDQYGDIGRTEQRYSHWAARMLKKLYMESLPKIKHKSLLHVNSNTFTATLPLDFYKETFIGGIDQKWNKRRIDLNTDLVDSKNILDVPCEDACPKCKQNMNICNDLVITEQKNLIVIGSNTYEQTIIKKLYPNGDYYLETTTPLQDINNVNNVTYSITKEFIANFDLKPCGCLDTTPNNIVTLQTYCPDIYCNYYSTCDNACGSNYGGYRIFEESGLIQFNNNFPFDKVYIEYDGFIAKKNGQYMVPYVAFETLVEGVKLKSIADRPNVPLSVIQYHEIKYGKERANMIKNMTKVSINMFLRAAAQLPKFDIDYNNDWYGCFSAPSNFQDSFPQVSNNNNSTVINNNTTYINRTSFVLNVKVDGNPGSPVANTSVYQNNILKGGTDLDYLFLAKQILTIKDNDFVFDNVAGTIDISPNTFQANDTLIANYNKQL